MNTFDATVDHEIEHNVTLAELGDIDVDLAIAREEQTDPRIQKAAPTDYIRMGTIRKFARGVRTMNAQ